MTTAASIIEANDAMSKGDEDKALKFYDQVIEIEPENAEAWFCKGHYSGGQRRIEASRRLLREICAKCRRSRSTSFI